MIGSLRGVVLEIRSNALLLEVQGIGFLVRASSNTLSNATAGSGLFLYVYDHVREDVRELFGFASVSEQELFERLLSVSGIGPKSAMTIISAGRFEDVKRAIAEGDVDFLSHAPGVGKKTAQKIVLELKGKLVDADTMAPGDVEVIQALESLGYASAQIREALKHVGVEIVSVEARVRESLKWLGK